MTLRCCRCHERKPPEQFGRCRHPQFASRGYRAWYCLACNRRRHAAQRQRTKLRHDHWIPETGPDVCPRHPTERLAFTTDGWGHTLAVCRHCGVQPVPLRGVRIYDQRVDTRLAVPG